MQFSNMPAMSTTLDVSRFESPSIETRLARPANRLEQSAGAVTGASKMMEVTESIWSAQGDASNVGAPAPPCIWSTPSSDSSQEHEPQLPSAMIRETRGGESDPPPSTPNAGTARTPIMRTDARRTAIMAHGLQRTRFPKPQPSVAIRRSPPVRAANAQAFGGRTSAVLLGPV